MKHMVFMGITAALLSLAVAANVSAARHHEVRQTEPDLTSRVTQPTGLAARDRQQPFQQRVQSILQEYQKEGAVKEAAKEIASQTKLQLLPMHTTDEGGTLLFSDSPEYVPTEGILYRDVVEGKARVLYYHLNNTSEPKKVAVVVENMYDGLNRVRVTRGGAGRPSDNYLQVGKEAQLQYFGNQLSSLNHIISMPRHDARLLIEDMNMIIMQPGELVYGCYDFEADHPVKVTVEMLDAYGDPVNESYRLPVLPKDEMRLRGTFTGMNRVLTPARPYHPERDGGVYFPLADNITDMYREGIDATDNSHVTNFGNYGILYKIHLPAAGRTPVQYLLSPLGGVYAGAVRMEHGTTSQRVETPANRLYFGDMTPPEPAIIQHERERGNWALENAAELQDLGTYNSDEETVLEFSPPGASNLPVNIILVPKK